MLIKLNPNAVSERKARVSEQKAILRKKLENSLIAKRKIKKNDEKEVAKS